MSSHLLYKLKSTFISYVKFNLKLNKDLEYENKDLNKREGKNVPMYHLLP